MWEGNINIAVAGVWILVFIQMRQIEKLSDRLLAAEDQLRTILRSQRAE